jgi:ABC-type transport system substrate-binding protein
MLTRAALPIVLLAAVLLHGCGGGGDADQVGVAFIGDDGALFEKGLRLSPAGQHARAATSEGLVAIDASGDIVPALAERWIVTDDGLSYIFRLRNSEWPDGEPITGEGVRDALRSTVRQLRGTSLGLDLGPVSEIRAMTGRVVEIRLATPVPDFLRLLAQPELGIRRKGTGAGPMTAERTPEGAIFTALPPEQRGLPADPNWRSRLLQVRSVSASDAVAAFNSGTVDLVLNGRLANLPLADTGPLSRGTVRLDAARGLFGLQVVSDEGLLADPARREALAMAIDRPGIIAPFNIAGWAPTTRIVAADLPEDQGTIGERWESLSLEQRRAEGRRRIAAWRNGAEPPTVRLALPPGPGSRTLLERLAADWATIGLSVQLVGADAKPDMELVDTLARFADSRWYLDQFACGVSIGICSSKADALVRAANAEPDALARAALLAEAEAELTALNAYIPLGAPIRWSLVRGDIQGFAENAWSFHPLFPLSQRPN